MANPASIIVSYDGTHNEDDAVALGRVFAEAGADVSLAYVRHSDEDERESKGEELLRRGAALLGGHEVGRHVITDRSTPEGLRSLAERVGANVIVFCSDSHTAQGHIAIGNSAQRLLEGGATAIAIAPAGFAKRAEGSHLAQIAASSEGEDATASETAQALAGALGASVIESSEHGIDLLVIGSRPDTEQGQVSLSASSERLIEDLATYPVLVVARGASLSFGSLGSLSA